MSCFNCCCNNNRRGRSGARGLSAYEIWINQDNVGTENDFLDSLKAVTEFGSFYNLGEQTINDGELITFSNTLSNKIVDINSSRDGIILGDAPYYSISIDTSIAGFSPGGVTIEMLTNGTSTGLIWNASVSPSELTKTYIIPNPGKGTVIQFRVNDGYISLAPIGDNAEITVMGINS